MSKAIRCMLVFLHDGVPARVLAFGIVLPFAGGLPEKKRRAKRPHTCKGRGLIGALLGQAVFDKRKW